MLLILIKIKKQYFFVCIISSNNKSFNQN